MAKSTFDKNMKKVSAEFDKVADDVKEEGYSFEKAQGALEGATLMFFVLTDAPTEFLSGIGKEVYERFLEKLVGVNDDI